jgi:putative transcriptional regulator
MSMYDDIVNGLNDAIDHEKGNLKLRTKKVRYTPPKYYKAEEIRAIRMMNNLTQASFADVMGVSKKTVEAWETGRNKPVGAACRLISLIETNASIPEMFIMR